MPFGVTRITQTGEIKKEAGTVEDPEGFIMVSLGVGGSRFARRMLITFGLVAIVAALGPVGMARAAAPGDGPARPQVVCAIDASRSLSNRDVIQIKQNIRALITALPGGTPVGVIAFNDAPVWLAPAGSTKNEAMEALSKLKLGGHYTLLNDALFTAARTMTSGGVIVLVTDGFDENSATTVDDVARICTTNDVHIISTASGHRVNTKSLRRLALVTGGAWEGRLNTAALPNIETAIKAAIDTVTHNRARLRRSPAPAPTPASAGTAARHGRKAVETAQPAEFPWWIVWVLILALAVAILVILLRRARTPPKRICDVCGAELQPWEETCPYCQIRELEETMKTQKVAGPSSPEVEEPPTDASILDPAIFTKKPLPEGLEQTMVLTERPVLVLKHRARPARTYTLPPDQVFAVGRAPKVNSLQIDDPTVSAQHFKIVPKDGEFYIVDLETTNGTAVNDERIRVRKLRSGDVIRAGAVELIFKMTLNRLG